MRRFSASILILTLALTACAPMKGYQGPVRPNSEVAHVYFHANDPLTLSSMYVDRLSPGLLQAGFMLLPGRHTFRVNYQIYTDDCSSYECSPVFGSGQCSGDFVAQPGKEYEIFLNSAGYGASATIYTDSRHTLVAAGDCT